MALNISKTPKINLTKGQSINLTKDGTESTSNLDKVFFGANWGAIKKGNRSFFSKLFGSGDETEAVDLDASLLLYSDDNTLLEKVYFGHKVSRLGNIKHSGDDRTGDSGEPDDSDNETISIGLNSIDKKVTKVVAILNSYTHQTFDEVPYIGLRIYTGKANDPDEVLCAYSLANDSNSFVGKEAIVLGHFYRSNSGWLFKADGITSTAKSIDEISKTDAISVL